MLKFQQIKNAFKWLDQDHPKFKNFMKCCMERAGTETGCCDQRFLLHLPEGKNYCSNIKLNAADIEMFEQLKSMKPE